VRGSFYGLCFSEFFFEYRSFIETLLSDRFSKYCCPFEPFTLVRLPFILSGDYFGPFPWYLNGAGSTFVVFAVQFLGTPCTFNIATYD
jgi:hypothetical protein